MSRSRILKYCKRYGVVSKHSEVKILKKSRVYVTGGRLQLYLDCSMDKEQSIEATHRILSHIEEELKGIFPNSIVEIHSEPA
ncbi:MAG: cation transporter dimerization domain-containing protein [Candidatus Bathyarchaeia archaeon]